VTPQHLVIIVAFPAVLTIAAQAKSTDLTEYRYSTVAQCVTFKEGEAEPLTDDAWTRFHPEAGLLELGLFGGVFLPSRHHDLREANHSFRTFGAIAPDLGARAAYFPFKFVGFEVEGIVVPTDVERGGGAEIWAVRGQLIGQLTSHRITPFALFGVGALGANSVEMGQNTDFAAHLGIGVKAALDETLSFRLDMGDTLSPSNSTSSGAAHHFEFLMGVTMTIGRSKPTPRPPEVPDTDHDGVPDTKDDCPTVAAKTPNGCLADADGDGVDDAVDQCPMDSGPATTGGCPDPDLDRITEWHDKCPFEPETCNCFEDEDGCPDTNVSNRECTELEKSKCVAAAQMAKEHAQSRKPPPIKTAPVLPP